MSESVGILGALQRRLLERVRASISRMSNLLDDMGKLASQEGKSQEVQPSPIDFNEIIDRAVGEATPRIQEKDIILSVDIPENLPSISGDQDAIEQIVIQLLENATTVTPPDGQIDLIARIDDSQEQPYLLLKITDTGGGIAPEDLPRVFWRQYRNENPVIPGIGDNGVGLTIARTLAEAQGGRIWVDSIPGISTTFSVLLPVTSAVASSLSESNESAA